MRVSGTFVIPVSGPPVTNKAPQWHTQPTIAELRTNQTQMTLASSAKKKLDYF
jgi:hypothetical protein